MTPTIRPTPIQELMCRQMSRELRTLAILTVGNWRANRDQIRALLERMHFQLDALDLHDWAGIADSSAKGARYETAHDDSADAGVGQPRRLQLSMPQ